MGNNQRANQVRLNHELLLWAGFTLTNGVWSYPDGVTVDDGVPFFPEDETLCFKWLVPAIEEKGWFWRITSKYVVLDKQGDYHEVSYRDHNTALAFCLAIQKLIRSK